MNTTFLVNTDGWNPDDCYVIPIQSRSLFYDRYCYLDTKDYMADRLFKDAGVHVKFGKEYSSPDSEYIYIFCKCRKKDRGQFLEAIRRLPSKALLLGHKDYLEASRKLISMSVKDTGIPGITDEALLQALDERRQEMMQEISRCVEDYLADVLNIIFSVALNQEDSQPTPKKDSTDAGISG